ncbi:MAG: acetate--CoA ligase family protein, partial [Deltaproteobacteria bacterium]|nr:acetate--CoA ligase family protein [Deltaproteobacteria bacterium]
MRFYEFEAKKLFARHGVPLPKNGTANTPDEAKQLAAEIGCPVVLKSQVLSGGRMKAGGVKFADTPDEAAKHAEAILKLEIKGLKPVCVLVEQKAPVKKEYYAGVTWDGVAKKPVIIFSDMGGID